MSLYPSFTLSLSLCIKLSVWACLFIDNLSFCHLISPTPSYMGWRPYGGVNLQARMREAGKNRDSSLLQDLLSDSDRFQDDAARIWHFHGTHTLLHAYISYPSLCPTSHPMSLSAYHSTYLSSRPLSTPLYLSLFSYTHTPLQSIKVLRSGRCGAT